MLYKEIKTSSKVNYIGKYKSQYCIFYVWTQLSPYMFKKTNPYDNNYKSISVHTYIIMWFIDKNRKWKNCTGTEFGCTVQTKLVLVNSYKVICLRC